MALVKPCHSRVEAIVKGGSWWKLGRPKCQEKIFDTHEQVIAVAEAYFEDKSFHKVGIEKLGDVDQ